MERLVDPLRPIQVLQPPLAQVPQRDRRRQFVPDQFSGRQREQDLPPVTGAEQPPQPVEHGRAVVAVGIGVDRPGVQRRPHPQRPRQSRARPVLHGEPELELERRRDGGLGRGEGGLERVADHLVDDPALLGDGPRSTASWQVEARSIAARCSRQSRVLPSISVKRKATVPRGAISHRQTSR